MSRRAMNGAGLFDAKVPSMLPVRLPAHFASTARQNTRLFGSKSIPGSLPGEIMIENEQSDLDLDLERLRATLDRIRSLLGYATWDVSLFLVDDQDMQAVNLETRGVNTPTDILSFPLYPPIEPGRIAEPDFDIADYYNLGDLMVDPAYVMRRVEEDRNYADDDEERGVSGAMARIDNAEERIHMLLIHGMLHLLGHDHEEDDEYELMVGEEERLLKELGMLKAK